MRYDQIWREYFKSCRAGFKRDLNISPLNYLLRRMLGFSLADWNLLLKKLKTFSEKHRRYDKEPWKSRNLRVLPVYYLSLNKKHESG